MWTTIATLHGGHSMERPSCGARIVFYVLLLHLTLTCMTTTNVQSQALNLSFESTTPSADDIELFALVEATSIESTEASPPINEQAECTPDKVIVNALLADYNKHRTPSERGVEVMVEAWLQNVQEVDERSASFLLDLYISEIWVDHALNFEHMRPCRQNLSLSFELLDQIWKPSTVFVNSLSADVHKSPFPNIFLVLYANGTIWVNERLAVRGPCTMEFSAFPLDSHRCSLTIESFNYNNREVNMQWIKQTAPLIILSPPIVLPDYRLTNMSTELAIVPYPAGAWNELTMTFVFSRRFGWYALQAYLPSLLTICVSWIGFCLGARMIPARTMLGVNSLLALTFQFGNVSRNLPRLSYVTALGEDERKILNNCKLADVWMLACLLFVFASLLELALVGTIANRNELLVKDRARQARLSSDIEEQPLPLHLHNAVAQTSGHLALYDLASPRDVDDHDRLASTLLQQEAPKQRERSSSPSHTRQAISEARCLIHTLIKVHLASQSSNAPSSPRANRALDQDGDSFSSTPSA